MIPFTVISPSADAVRVTFVKGTRAALCGASEAAGWVAALTLMLDPVVPVPVPVPVPVHVPVPVPTIVL